MATIDGGIINHKATTITRTTSLKNKDCVVVSIQDPLGEERARDVVVEECISLQLSHQSHSSIISLTPLQKTLLHLHTCIHTSIILYVG